MAEIVISEFMDQSAVDYLKGKFDVYYDADLVNKPDELARQAKHCRALIVRNRTQARGELLQGGTLKVVGRLGVGLDNIDCEACEKLGIKVIPATGANDISVAEYVIAGILMLLRGSYGATKEVLAGDWPRMKLVGNEAHAKTLGLVGFGSIARETASRARALGMRVIAYDPFVAADDPVWSKHDVKKCELDDLLQSCDVLSIHAPLNAATRHMLDPAEFAKIKTGAIVVNAARGGVAEESALADALRSGKLKAAMIDVFEDEPLPANSCYRGLDNIILTPHIAGVTKESNARVSALIAQKVAEELSKDA